MISKKFLAAAALAACSAVAQAAPVGPYVGGAFGFTHVTIDCPAYYTCDESDVGFKFYGGYNFTPLFGVQADYIDFGAVSSTSPFGTKSLELSTSLIGVAGVLNFDFGHQWSGAAKLGLANSSVDGSGVLGNGSKSATKLYGGFDVGYAINPKLKLRAGWDFSGAEYTNRVGVSDDFTVHLFSVGASYSF